MTLKNTLANQKGTILDIKQFEFTTCLSYKRPKHIFFAAAALNTSFFILHKLHLGPLLFYL